MSERMPGSIELMTWRASLAEAPVLPRAADLSDWAAVLARAGEAAGAALLEDAAALRRGFHAPAEDATAEGWTIDRLHAELDSLAAAFVLSDARPPAVRVSGYPNEEGGIGPAEPRVEPPADLAAGARQLRDFLSAPYDPERSVAVAGLLAALVEAHARLPGLDYRAWRHAPLDELAFAIGLTSLAEFALASRDLAGPPFGSVALLHRVARLHPEGLGPYLVNVGRVARGSGDLLGLARRAVALSGPGATHDAWLAFLARGCTGATLSELVDRLGDWNRSAALSLVLDRALSHVADLDLPLIRRLRDIGLDNADWALATAAQTAIARRPSATYHEQVLLASILATSGAHGPAEWILRGCLVDAPQDPEVLARLAATRRNDFAGYEILGGFTSPADRQETRFRRRGLLPDHMPRQGSRITAVDVG